MNTGKKRDVTDKFYTKLEVAEKCINLFLKTININKKKDDILDKISNSHDLPCP